MLIKLLDTSIKVRQKINKKRLNIIWQGKRIAPASVSTRGGRNSAFNKQKYSILILRLRFFFFLTLVGFNLHLCFAALSGQFSFCPFGEEHSQQNISSF